MGRQVLVNIHIWYLLKVEMYVGMDLEGIRGVELDSNGLKLPET